jgi:cellulose synthase/poly-beta-1,6-N-acetylglucosamine synthase-like glycosyltransferase
MVLLFILGCCIHLEKKIFPQVLDICEFFSPVAEVLLQLLAVISGVFFTLALLFLISTEPCSSIIFFLISLFIFFLSALALTINRVITHNYKKIIEKES